MHSEKLQYVVFSEVKFRMESLAKEIASKTYKEYYWKRGKYIDIEATRVIICLFY